MENQIQVFTNEDFGKVRVISIEDEPYFVGTDVAKILGYANPNTTLKTRVDEEDCVRHSLKDGLGRTQEAIFINESGLYSLILSSKKEESKKFKHWVTSEILPSIRKHGAYMTDLTIEKLVGNPDMLIQLATQLKEERQARKEAEMKFHQNKPLIDFATTVADKSDCITIGETAKLINNENINVGRNRLFRFLKEQKILMDNNLPYQIYIDKQYFEVREIVKKTSYGEKVFLQTLVTGKGQIFIVQKVKDAFGLKEED